MSDYDPNRHYCWRDASIRVTSKDGVTLWTVECPCGVRDSGDDTVPERYRVPTGLGLTIHITQTVTSMPPCAGDPPGGPETYDGRRPFPDLLVLRLQEYHRDYRHQGSWVECLDSPCPEMWAAFVALKSLERG